MNDTILEVRNLKMYFPVIRGILKRKVTEAKAVDDISFKITRGKTVGLIGESGCGKTTTARCILKIYRPTGGQIFLEGQDIHQLPRDKIKYFRRRVQLLFQDPFGSLDPRQSAGSIVGEPLKVHHLVNSNDDYKTKVEEIFRNVKLDPSMVDRFPHEFSGGQRQRIGLARALAAAPSLIVCDEPVSALDVSIQAQMINLLEELQEASGVAYLFIAHDLSVVWNISQQIVVMYLGHIMEVASGKELYENPLHPYTKALLSAVPIPDPFIEKKRELFILKGDVPSPVNPPSGCCFHPRCSLAVKECSQVVLPLRDVGNEHKVACVRV